MKPPDFAQLAYDALSDDSWPHNMSEVLRAMYEQGRRDVELERDVLQAVINRAADFLEDDAPLHALDELQPFKT